MIETVKTILASHHITQWRLIAQERQRAEISLANGEAFDEAHIHQTNFTQKITLTVYQDFFRHGRRYLGQASVEVQDPIDLEDLDQSIVRAVKEAGDLEDPWFPLENKGSVHGQKAVSSLQKQDLAHWLLPFHEAVLRAKTGQTFELDKEFLMAEKENLVYNDCFGRELVHLSHCARVELSFVVEGADCRTVGMDFSEFVPERLTEFVQEEAQISQGIAQAQRLGALPEAVFIRGPLVSQAFSYVVRQLSARQLYAGISRENLNKYLWGRAPQGDKITLTALSELYNSPYSTYFDEQGVVLQSRLLVSDGVITGFLAQQETSHYLALPLTGQNLNFSVSPGSLDLSVFKGQPYLEIWRVHNFTLTEETGDFHAEIDLAYWYDGNCKRPVRGALLKGNLRALLTESQFSREMGSWEFYEGPELLKIPHQFVTGV